MTVSIEKFYGSDKNGETQVVDPFTTQDIHFALSRLWRLNPTAAGQNADLPPANELPLRAGGPVFYIINTGTQTLTVRDGAGFTVGTIPSLSASVLFLSDDTTIRGTWFMRTAAYSTP